VAVKREEAKNLLREGGRAMLQLGTPPGMVADVIQSAFNAIDHRRLASTSAFILAEVRRTIRFETARVVAAGPHAVDGFNGFGRFLLFVRGVLLAVSKSEAS
jgi:hypothetical protein